MNDARIDYEETAIACIKAAATLRGLAEEYREDGNMDEYSRLMREAVKHHEMAERMVEWVS